MQNKMKSVTKNVTEVLKKKLACFIQLKKTHVPGHKGEGELTKRREK